LLDDSRSKTTDESGNLDVDFSELDVINKIGSGAFGVIYKCRWRGILVAAKFIKSINIFELLRDCDNIRNTHSSVSDKHIMTASEITAVLNDFWLEISILKTLRHPNMEYGSVFPLYHAHTRNVDNT